MQPFPSSKPVMAPSSKRSRPHNSGHHLHHNGGEEEVQPLLPGLPDHLAQLCLARLPATLLYPVCRKWRRLLYAPSFPPFLSLYALLSSSKTHHHPITNDHPVDLQSYDPISSTWRQLPPPPPHQLLLRHPSFIARNLPIQSVSTSCHVILLAATTRHLLPALPRPLAFHPPSNQWQLGPPVGAPRRWCISGSSGGKVYIASGVGSKYSPEIARSAERWDPSCRTTGGWERVAPLKDGKFSRDAVAAVASRGKLCMVNMKGKGAKEGAVYDVGRDRWEDMPAGMVAGWTGPAASSEDDDDGGRIYVADELDGTLRVYDWGKDTWTPVVISERLKGTVQMAAGGGRVCVVTSDGSAVVVVDVGSGIGRGRLWVVEPPAGKLVVAVHVLPRIGCNEL